MITFFTRSQNCSVGVVAGSWCFLRNQGSNAGRAKTFSLFKVLRLALGLTAPPIQWIVGSTSFGEGVGGDGSHLDMKPSAAKVKSA